MIERLKGVLYTFKEHEFVMHIFFMFIGFVLLQIFQHSVCESPPIYPYYGVDNYGDANDLLRYEVKRAEFSASDKSYYCDSQYYFLDGSGFVDATFTEELIWLSSLFLIVLLGFILASFFDKRVDYAKKFEDKSWQDLIKSLPIFLFSWFAGSYLVFIIAFYTGAT